MPLSMLELIAQLFESNAKTQDELFAKRTTDTAESKRCVVRANVWRKAARELREIGALNRDKFEKEIHEMLYMRTASHDDIVYGMVKRLLNLFITPPIPAPTPRDSMSPKEAYEAGVAEAKRRRLQREQPWATAEDLAKGERLYPQKKDES